jgi:Glycosyl hydrolase family 26
LREHLHFLEETLKRTASLSLLTLAAMTFAATASQAAVSYAPVTAGATGGAQKLYNFLATNYGVKTISGMMTGDIGSGTDVKALVDVDSMFLKSGKYPALVGFDFLFATGVKASDSWYQSYTASALTHAKDLWTKGGIPAFTWHWKDPSDSIDAFYTKSGNAKEYTTFDYTKGFKTGTTTWDTTSATYKQLVSDIDEIAAKFLSLQKDSVAAIFRPLHEASGGWFWWGTKGGAAYQSLYNLVHDRMVDVDGVKNLVWVWNPEYASDAAWNPGATKYDVISMDIYEAYDYTTKFVTGYKALTTNFGTDKILAVSENGPIPDASTMKTNGTVWSWWMPWYQSWSGKFLNQTVDAVWKANMEDPCTITLDKMPGWSSYNLANSKASACTNGYKLGDLDTVRNVVEKVPGDTATNGWLKVKFNAASGDTAKGNVIISAATVPKLSTAKSITMNVVNGNTMTGFWFTTAFLGNASTSWAWAQPSGTTGGCWVNPGDSAKCTIDLTTMTQDKVNLTGSAYTNFMGNLYKIYIECFGLGFAGSVFFDNIVVDGSTVINNFDKAQDIVFESDKNLVTADIVGHAKTSGIRTGAKASANRISVQGKMLQLTLAESGIATVDLLDLQGSRIANLHSGNLTAGAHALSLGNIKEGLYVVRAKGTNLDATEKVIVK